MGRWMVCAGAAGGGWFFRGGLRGLLPDSVLQRFVEQIIFEDVVAEEKDAREAHRKPGHYFYELFVLPRVHASVTEAFGRVCCGCLRPEAVSPSALGNLDFYDPLASDSSHPVRQSTEAL